MVCFSLFFTVDHHFLLLLYVQEISLQTLTRGEVVSMITPFVSKDDMYPALLTDATLVVYSAPCLRLSPVHLYPLRDADTMVFQV